MEKGCRRGFLYSWVAVIARRFEDVLGSAGRQLCRIELYSLMALELKSVGLCIRRCCHTWVIIISHTVMSGVAGGH